MKKLNGEAWVVSDRKRWLDAGLSIAALPLVASVVAPAAATVAVVDRHHPLYLSKRLSRGGDKFTMYKLQTMPPGTELSGSTGHMDERRTKLGAFLAKSHIDEMPQVLNIFRGDMSWVGPRALPQCVIDDTLDVLSPEEQREWLCARDVALPGAFGLHQIRAKRSDYEDINTIDGLRERAASDVEYVFSRASLATDMRIISATTEHLIRAI